MKGQHRKFAVLLLLGGLFAGYSSPASAQAPFKIDALSSNNVSAIDKHFVAGDDRDGIAVSTQKVFLTGDNK